MPRTSGNSPIIRDFATLIEKRCRRAADVLTVEAAEMEPAEEWARIGKQLSKPEVVKSIVDLARERLKREPGTIRPRKVE